MNAKPQMSFVEAVKTVVVEKYCCFTGRARRSEYWWYTLATSLLSCAITAIFGTDSTAGTVVSSLISLGLLLPGLGVAVRRMHDLGKSGWCILWGLIPVVGWIILIVWCATDSVAAANEYGPSPKYEE